MHVIMMNGHTYLKVCSKDTRQVANGQQGQGVVVASPADKPQHCTMELTDQDIYRLERMLEIGGLRKAADIGMEALLVC